MLLFVVFAVAIYKVCVLKTDHVESISRFEGAALHAFEKKKRKDKGNVAYVY